MNKNKYVIHCPECDVYVLACDNNVYLDIPAQVVNGNDPQRQWTVMQLGHMVLASAGDPSPDGKAHTLHEHQPPEMVEA